MDKDTVGAFQGIGSPHTFHKGVGGKVSLTHESGECTFWWEKQITQGQGPAQAQLTSASLPKKRYLYPHSKKHTTSGYCSLISTTCCSILVYLMGVVPEERHAPPPLPFPGVPTFRPRSTPLGAAPPTHSSSQSPTRQHSHHSHTSSHQRHSQDSQP